MNNTQTGNASPQRGQFPIYVVGYSMRHDELAAPVSILCSTHENMRKTGADISQTAVSIEFH